MTKQASRKFELNRVFDFTEKNTVRVNAALAKEIGLNESILLLQLEFWIATSGQIREGQLWVYESISTIQEHLVFLSESTINRSIRRLQELKLIHIGNFNRRNGDRTRWFSINYPEVAKLKSISSVRVPQNDTGSNQNGTSSTQNGTHSSQNGTGLGQYEPTLPES